MDARTRELIEKYLDLRLKGPEWAELEERLVENREAAEAFAQATRLDAGLETLLHENAMVRDVTQLFAGVENVGTVPVSRPPRRAVDPRKALAVLAAYSVIGKSSGVMDPEASWVSQYATARAIETVSRCTAHHHWA